MFSAIRRITLTQWIMVSMVLGVAFGALFPEYSQDLKVVSTHAKALTQSLGEKPNRLIFSGKAQKLVPEDEILRSAKPLPAVKP